MKINSFSKYQEIVGQNVFLANASHLGGNSSYFRHWNPLKTVGIANSIPVPTQFLYLYFLTKKMPFLARKHPTKLRYRTLTARNDSAKIASYIHKRRINFVMNKLFFQFMAKQLFPEHSAIKIDKHFTKIFVWNAPLYEQTFGVQVERNLAIEDIPLFYKFATKNLFLAEIAFFVSFFQFLKKTTLVLDEMEVVEYKWLE